MSEKMPNAPVFYMAAQVKFGSVLEMNKSIGALQSVWRHQYPDFSVQVLNQLQLNFADGPEGAKFTQNAVTRWHFKDIAGTSGLVLTIDSLVFHTTAYDTSASFISALLDALANVHQAVGLSYIQAIGFRSLDAILPSGEKDLTFFLEKPLLGLYPVLDGVLKQSILELVMRRDAITVASRCMLLNGNLGIPADLFPIQLNIASRFQEINDVHAVLDNDAIWTVRLQIDFDQVRLHLKELKAAISDAFYKSVTKDAIDYWKTPYDTEAPRVLAREGAITSTVS